LEIQIFKKIKIKQNFQKIQPFGEGPLLWWSCIDIKIYLVRWKNKKRI